MFLIFMRHNTTNLPLPNFSFVSSTYELTTLMIMSLLGCKAHYSNDGSECRRESRRNREKSERMERKKRRAEIPVSSDRVWRDYGVERVGIEDGGRNNGSSGEGIKIVFLSYALWKMDI